jgi:hypothetical protein
MQHSCYNNAMTSEQDKPSENPYNSRENPSTSPTPAGSRTGWFLPLGIAWTVLVLRGTWMLVESRMNYEVLGSPDDGVQAQFGTVAIPLWAAAIGAGVLVVGWAAAWFLVGRSRP